MSSRYTLSKEVFDSLLKQLVDLEENKDKLLDEYATGLNDTRTDFQNMLENYLQALDQLVQNTSIIEETAGLMPFVTIGSEVQVSDLNTNFTETFMIVTPFHDNTTDNTASYLSPIGSGLLLKKPGDQVAIHTPSGLINFQINAIRFATHALSPPC